jgi:hypothetical protein
MAAWPWYRAHVAHMTPEVRLPESGQLTGPMLASGEVTTRPIFVTQLSVEWDATIERGRLLHRVVPR